MNKRILIIGGMGPQASLCLHQKIIDAAIKQGITGGADFPLITHVSIPVPEFLNNNREKMRALTVLKRHLYCLWRPRLHTCGYSL